MACRSTCYRASLLAIARLSSVSDNFRTRHPTRPHPQVGKVSVRFVPNQEPGALVELLTAHINHEFAKLRSPNTCSVAVRCWGEWGALVTLPGCWV